MTAVIFKVETNGFPLWAKPSDDPLQPHIVRIYAEEIDNKGNVLFVFDELSKPDGWEITKETESVHGISNKQAIEHGIDESELIDRFFDFIDDRRMVCYMKNFEQRMLRIAIKRHFGNDSAEDFKNREGVEGISDQAKKINGLNHKSSMQDVFDRFSVNDIDTTSTEGKVHAIKKVWMILNGL